MGDNNSEGGGGGRPEIDEKRFFSRIGKIYSQFIKSRSAKFNNASCISINRAPINSEDTEHNSMHVKSSSLHQYLFGYELPDTIMLLTAAGEGEEGGKLYFLATKKKIEFLSKLKENIPKDSSIKEIQFLTKSKADNNHENYNQLLLAAGVKDDKKDEEDNKDDGGEEKKQQSSSTKTVIGVLMKERTAINMEAADGTISKEYEKALDASEKVELVDISPLISLTMAIKDESEYDLIKKSSVLSNKILKHGVTPRIEEIIDSEINISHEKLAEEINTIIENPKEHKPLKLNIASDDVDPCYFPIVQSGGQYYDLKISAQSNGEKLKYDIITVSLGSRYKMYCSNIARTYLFDPPKKVTEIYEKLLEMQEKCIQAMQPGKPLKFVYKTAQQYLQTTDGGKYSWLSEKLPKNLGFAIGLEFRDSSLVLNSKNNIPFKAGMVFNLMIGFINLELVDKDKTNTSNKSAVHDLNSYALLLADMVGIKPGGDNGAEILTKLAKSATDISYTINDDDDDDDDDSSEEEDDDKPTAPKGDKALARKLAKEERSGTDNNDSGVRKSRRLEKDQAAQQEVQEGVVERERRQIDLMKRRNEERLRELARLNRNKNADGSEEKAEELETYKRTRDYPDNVQPNQVKVDMANQCVILPICGTPVPFHISTIKNVVLPDPDEAATYLRINFYTAGMALGKDAPSNIVKLVQKYAPYASFIREMTFRSLDSHNLTVAFRQISELRKRARTRELREIEEANLVEQEKLVRTKNERVPRLSDLTMRPVIHGRKTQGNLEAHTNGLRFISTRQEIIDIMYKNIKYAIYQPCENEIMVLIHFHLKNPIMVGKKRHTDIQFFTEVVDASQTVDAGRRSMYDPDEMDDEQRERQLRKKLNQAFKDFCKKVDTVAKKNNYELEFDIPYRDLGFTGNPHKEMVSIQPTLNCLVNLTETPFFVVDLAHVDHVHFERITYMSKAFDMVLINKDFTKQPWTVTMIPNGDKDAIQEWLTDMEITYTQGPMNLNWKSIMATINGDDRFYMNTEEDEVTEKEAGWEFLRMYGNDDEQEEEEEEESDYSEAPGEESEEEEGDESEFDSEEEEESDYDADEDLEEQGMDWDDMEREAAREDRGKVDVPSDDEGRAKSSKKRRGSAPRQQQRSKRGRR